jgi:hypothetical protein
MYNPKSTFAAMVSYRQKCNFDEPSVVEIFSLYREAYL